MEELNRIEELVEVAEPNLVEEVIDTRVGDTILVGGAIIAAVAGLGYAAYRYVKKHRKEKATTVEFEEVESEDNYGPEL